VWAAFLGACMCNRDSKIVIYNINIWLFRLVSSDFIISLFLWFIRAFVSSVICLFIGYLGLRMLDRITIKISEFKQIRGDPLATAFFVSGFLIFAGFVVYGSMVNPFFLGQSVLYGSYFNLQRLLIVGLSSIVSLLFGWIFYYVFAHLTPFEVDLDDVNRSPLAVGVFLFGYEIFLGMVIYASLTIPLA
jgi:hypothetical protein